MSGRLDGGAINWDEIEWGQGVKKARSKMKIYMSGHANADAPDAHMWVCQEPVRDTGSEVWASITSLEAL